MLAGIKGADYEFQPSFILGFHGCEREVGEKILSGMEPDLKASEKEYDWLGSGIYFWEGNLTRAWAWAEQRMAGGKIGEGRHQSISRAAARARRPRGERPVSHWLRWRKANTWRSSIFGLQGTDRTFP